MQCGVEPGADDGHGCGIAAGAGGDVRVQIEFRREVGDVVCPEDRFDLLDIAFLEEGGRFGVAAVHRLVQVGDHRVRFGFDDDVGAVGREFFVEFVPYVEDDAEHGRRHRRG